MIEGGGSQIGGTVKGAATEFVRTFSRELVKASTPPEIHDVLLGERKRKPESSFVPGNEERANRPVIESRPDRMAAPINFQERADRMQSQSRIKEIRQELRRA
jgi:hypothetical protein